MTDTDLLPCPSCYGEGYTVEVRPVCCGKNPDGSCHGDCPVPEQYQEQCGDCCGTGEIPEASTPSSTRANERGDDSLQAQIAYSAYLQQIIEALCHGHPIPEPKGTAVHHYEMAVAYRKTPHPSPQSDMVAVPRKTLDKIMYFLKYLEGWQGKDGDAVVVEVAEDAIALLQPYTKGE